MINQTFVENLQKNISKLFLLCTLFLALFLLSPAASFADDLNNSGLQNQIEGSVKQELNNAQTAIENIKEDIQQSADRVGDQFDSTTTQIQGEIQKNVGKAQTAINDVKQDIQQSADRMGDQFDAKTKQFQGEIQQNIGKTQETVQETGNKLEDNTENFFQSIRNKILDIIN